MGDFHLPQELPIDMEKPIFATWFNHQTGEHRCRVIQNTTTLEVLHTFADKGVLEIYTYVELGSKNN